MLGVIMVTVGYMDKKIKKAEKEKEIEYRFVPKSIYEQQIQPVNLSDTFSTMFSDIDPIFDGK